MVTARFARAFSLLLSSGMTLSEALDAVEIIIGNRYLKKKFRIAADGVRHGMTLTNAFDSNRLFPDMMIQMVAVGESSNTLEEVLLRSCAFFDVMVETSLNKLTSKLQPIMLIIMGGVIGTLFLAVYAPMLTIMTTI
jgi:type IV pilus assembly protein PilC